MIDIDVSLLTDCPRHAPLLASWIFELWRGYHPDFTLENAQHKIKEYFNEDELPLMYVALKDNEPIGMCSLRADDKIFPDLTPRLSTLFVNPLFQGNKVGEQLISKIISKARSLNYNELYLLSFDQSLTNWFKKLGWKLMSIDEINGHSVSIMLILL